MKLRNQKGRSLIELIIIIVILGIIAALAIPKYQEMGEEKKEELARDALGSLRSGITVFYAKQAVLTGVARWPTLRELVTVGTVMENGIPENPYQSEFPQKVITGSTKGETRGIFNGWLYDPETGEIWLNTKEVGENTW